MAAMSGRGGMSPQPAGRSAALDFCRVLALGAIFVGHVWYEGWPLRITYAWHVPIFFILSGYLWRPGRELRQEWKRRWSSLVVPYIVWWFVVAAVSFVWALTQGAVLGPYFYALAAWGGVGGYRPFTAFWFFPALTVAVLFLRLVQNRSRLLAWAVPVVAIMLCQVFTHVAQRLPLSALVGVGCALFILVGSELRRIRERVHAPIATGAALLAVGALGVAVPGYEHLELKLADFGTPAASVVAACLIACGLILLSEGMFDRYWPGGGRYWTVLAQCATFVMLSQGLVLMMMRTPTTGGWLDFVLVVTVPYALALATLPTRLSPWLHGREPLVWWRTGSAPVISRGRYDSARGSR